MKEPSPWATPWSVSRVLRTRWPLPKFIPQEALERGRRVHAVTEALDQDRLVDPEEDILGWVSAYKTFLRDVRPDYEFIEHRVEQDSLKFHGVIDRVGTLGGAFSRRRCIIDLKTGPKKPQDSVQTAAYSLLLDPPRYDTLDRYGLYLRRDGSYKLRKYDSPYDFITWLVLLHRCAGTVDLDILGDVKAKVAGGASGEDLNT